MKAQFLARLGYVDNTQEAARHVMSQTPDDAQRLYEAALVYSVIGDHDAALSNTKKSVRRGMRPRWFNASAFDSLRSGPRFKAALLKSERLEQGR